MDADIEKIVSIIIPCYNAEKCIIQCLESINQSSYPNDYIEVLLIDGISTDMTIQLVKQYQKDNDLHIKIINNKKGIKTLVLI